MELSEVLWYTQQHGYKHPLPVLPLVPKGKIPPSGTHGHNSATFNWEFIRNYWGENPDYNVGVATGKQGGIVVIDVDQKPDGGKFGEENLEALEDELGALPDTWTVLSGGGGRHLYFRFPDGVDSIRSRNGEIAPDIDIKADGGFTVVPPSIHNDTGRPYIWEASLSPEDIPLADLPQAWLDVLMDKRLTWLQQEVPEEEKKQTTKQGISSKRFVLPDVIPHGIRNTTLFKYACSLRRKGKTHDEVMNLVMQANEEKAKPPVPVREVRGIVKSAMSYDDGTTDSSKYTPFAEKNNTTPDTQKQAVEVTKNEVSEVPPEEDPKGDYEVMETDLSIDPEIDLPPVSGDPLARFHKKNDKGKISGIYDEYIVDDVMEKENFFIISEGLGSMIFVYRDGAYSSIRGEAFLSQAIEQRIYPWVRTASNIGRLLRRFPQKPQCLVTPDDLDKQPPRFINFLSGYYDPLHKVMYDHDPKYLTLNVIPYDFDPEEQLSSPEVDQWLEFAFPVPEVREVFLQYMGYCLTSDNTKKKFLWITGKPNTGKSLIGKVAKALVGAENTSAVSLRELTTPSDSGRFARIGLFGKLVNPIYETSSAEMEDVSLLKSITGGDAISGEKKGGDRVDFEAKTRFIFCTNFTPRVQGETSSAFFDRGIYIRMDSVPDELDEEFINKVILPNKGYLYHLCVDAVGRMYQQKHFSIPDSSKEERDALFYLSDPVQRWLDSCVVLDETSKALVKKTDAYKSFTKFCQDENIPKDNVLSSGGWAQALSDKGAPLRRLNGSWYLKKGYTLKDTK